MIDICKIKFWDIVYVVNEKNNAFARERIKMVDADGIEWFRYDRDQWEWSISEITYCGHTAVTITGEIETNSVYQNEMHFKYPNGDIYSEYECEMGELENWFLTREEAEVYIEQQKLLKLK